MRNVPVKTDLGGAASPSTPRDPGRFQGLRGLHFPPGPSRQDHAHHTPPQDTQAKARNLEPPPTFCRCKGHPPRGISSWSPARPSYHLPSAGRTNTWLIVHLRDCQQAVDALATGFPLLRGLTRKLAEETGQRPL